MEIKFTNHPTLLIQPAKNLGSKAIFLSYYASYKKEANLLMWKDEQVVMDLALNLDQGLNRIHLNCRHLDKGEYTISLFFTNEAITRQICLL